jgi:hypothetical protein
MSEQMMRSTRAGEEGLRGEQDMPIGVRPIKTINPKPKPAM